MKTRIFVSVALAGLLGFNLVGCGSQPKTLEEMSKLSKEELKKIINEECYKDGKIRDELNEEAESKLQTRYDMIGNKERIKLIDENPSKFSELFKKCAWSWFVYHEKY